jgi:S-formylglutathione hydrolase
VTSSGPTGPAARGQTGRAEVQDWAPPRTRSASFTGLPGAPARVVELTQAAINDAANSGLSIMSITQRSVNKCFGGHLSINAHPSSATGTEIRFAVFEPAQAPEQSVAALFFLAGLTCTEETFMIRAGALRLAAEHGLLLVAPDTSPRGAGLPGEDDNWDFGTGAGFYIDAAAEPWSRHYRMATYITRELPTLIETLFAVRPGVRGIFGHSMGGHGAQVTALRDLASWRSVPALA